MRRIRDIVTVIYDGVEYHKVSDKWVDSNCVMAPKGIQNELDFLQLKQMNLDDYNVYQLMQLGEGADLSLKFAVARKLNIISHTVGRWLAAAEKISVFIIAFGI